MAASERASMAEFITNAIGTHPLHAYFSFVFVIIALQWAGNRETVDETWRARVAN
jgi:hypothetical protein